jgi:hypothetical protein
MVTDNLKAMKKFIFIIFLAGLTTINFVSCDDNIDPLVSELELDRTLTPTGLTARIRTLTTIELTWNLREGVDHYVVEFSEDSLTFNSIIRTVTVAPDELPLQETFEGETRYSARVKAVSATGLSDSKWNAVTIKTDLENIYLPIENGDIEALTATLRWPAGSDVTRFVINPGNVERIITEEEQTAGVATIENLSGSTNYTVLLYNGTKQRGSVSFLTLIDVGDATRVYPEDDLSAVIAAAADGDVLVLYPGDYTVNNGATIVLNKSLSIKGLYPYDKPKLHVTFNIETGAGVLEFSDLDLSGNSTLTTTFNLNSATAEHTSISLSGCIIHDFGRQLIYGNVAAKLGTFSIDNCIISDFVAGGGDFIDFRSAYVGNVNITNSTFDNCAPQRDFIRIDAAATYTGTGLTTNVLIDHSTIYGVSNSQDRILYVRFNANVLTVRNTLIAATDGYYTNQASTTQPVCLNNNYFNAIGFFTPAYVTNVKIDDSGTHTTLDPGFANAAEGDFTISNQTLIDNQVGDPRWRP